MAAIPVVHCVVGIEGHEVSMLPSRSISAGSAVPVGSLVTDRGRISGFAWQAAGKTLWLHVFLAAVWLLLYRAVFRVVGFVWVTSAFARAVAGQGICLNARIVSKARYGYFQGRARRSSDRRGVLVSHAYVVRAGARALRLGKIDESGDWTTTPT